MRSLLLISASLAFFGLAGCEDRGDEGENASLAPGGEFTPGTEAGAANSAPDGAGEAGTAPPAGTVVTPAPETLPPENMPEVVRPEGGVMAPGDPPPTLPPDSPGSPGTADPAGPSI